jgi:hypothetical protein
LTLAFFVKVDPRTRDEAAIRHAAASFLISLQRHIALCRDQCSFKAGVARITAQ